MGKFFTVDVKPTVPASLQHAGAFGAGEVLFDWTAFQVPKGSSCLRSITALVRPKGDTTPTANAFAFTLVFSKTNTQSLGTVNSTVDNRPSNDLLGIHEFFTGQFGPTSMNSTMVATSTVQGDNEGASAPLVLTPTPTTGDNVGYDTLYVGGIGASTSWDFSSINAIAEAGAAEAASTQAITMDGADMDVREHFIAGDVLHIGTSVGSPAADSVIGTVESVSNASTGPINLTAVSETALVDGDILYNIHPIRLILHFEK